MIAACPHCTYQYRYATAEVENLRAESQVDIEGVNGWNFLSIIEYPLREHVRLNHTHHDLICLTRSRWWL